MATTRRGGAGDDVRAKNERTVRAREASRRSAVVEYTEVRGATVRKVDPWSVLKLSLVFYFFVLLVVMLGLAVFWTFVNRVGLIEQLTSFMSDLQLEIELNGVQIARAVFLVGILNVVLWSGINVFLAFLYNLVADLVGGIRVTLEED